MAKKIGSPPETAKRPIVGELFRAAAIKPAASIIRENLLKTIVEGTFAGVGDEFFQSMVKHLAVALQVRYCFIARMDDKARHEAVTIAMWNGERIAENFRYDIRNTPCEHVVDRMMCIYSDNVARLFPKDAWLADNGVESYMAIPLFSTGGVFLGHMGVMDVKPLIAADNAIAVLKIFAARAAGELERAEIEKERERFFNLSPDLMCVADDEGRFKKVNPAFVRTLGFSTGELLAKPVLEFVHPADRAKTLREAQRHRRGKPVSDFEIRFLCKDGSHRWLSWRTAADFDSGVVYATGRDITEARRAREIIDESEERYRQIFQQATDYILVLEPRADGPPVITDASDSAFEKHGYTRDELIGKPITFLDTVKSQQAVPERMKFLAAGAPVQFEAEHRRKDGTKFPVEVAAKMITLGGKTLVYTIERDITGRKKAEEEMRAAKETAEEATRLKDNFVSLVAHDLKSPFTALMGFQRLLLNDADQPLAPDHRTLVERMFETSREMVLMINELLDLSRLQTGAIKPEREFIDLSLVAAFCAENNRYAADTKRVKLENGVRKKTRIYADARLFAEVLQNLVTNAIKFTPPGGTVRLFVPPGGNATVAVGDTGMGIPPDLMPHLFRLDIKTSTVGTHGERGTGLGLPYSADILKAHGGDISVESEPGKGTVFFVRLPHIRPQALIVDDEQVVRHLLTEFIKPLDVDFIYAENGEKALEKMRRVTPHLVISDIRMPGMDGYGLLRHIREELRLKSLPVILVTSDHDIKTREKAFQLGASDFLTKPLEIEEIVPRVRRFLEKGFTR